jgi:carbon monoxide dehydrogenase subunit G
MEVKLDKQYPLDVDAARAWALLTDLKATANCMPGAEITEQLSETSYKGGVKVKVGPAVAQFGGTVDVVEAVPAERKMVLRGKGADKGGSSASMDLTAIITADPANPAHCVLNGQAAVIVNGKFAQFGGRLMVQVSDMLLAQFVENFRQTALTLPAAEGSPAASTAAQVEASAAASGGDTAAPAAAPKAPVVAREINGLAIFWSLVKSWFGGLFGKKA